VTSEHTALVRVPACELLPTGQEMTAQQLRDLLQQVGRADPEHGHGLVDDLLLAALHAIRDGHPDPRGLAEAVLITASAEFPRWRA
jgi:hypothetical protein